MRRVLAIFLLSVPTPLILDAAAQQRDQAPAAPATGRIAGAVIGAESGRPVRFAKVVLTSGAGTADAVTDEAGGFSFDKLGAGSYAVSVSKPGYLDAAYGQTRPGTNTAGTPIRLRDREQIDRLVIPLSHGGSISGVVRDERGEPAYRATVRALRWVMRNGVRTLDEVKSVEADERGMYRFSLLPSRSYVISAAAADDAIPETKAATEPFGFAPMFYPASATADNATTIPLGVGEDRPNIDLQLPLVPLARVTGIVMDADGRPAAGVHVSLVDGAGSGANGEQGTETKAHGRFTFDRVPPGPYVVHAGQQVVWHTLSRAIEAKEIVRGDVLVQYAREKMMTYDIVMVDDGMVRKDGSVVHASEGPRRGTALADVSAARGVASDLVLTLEPPREVSGRVVFEGASARPPLTGMQVSLTGVGASSDTTGVTVKDDGAFVIPNVAPGRYVVTLGPGGTWNLTSAVAAGVETLDFLLDVPRDRDVRDLTMTLTDRVTELSGVVIDPSAQPAGDRMVIAFAADERLWGAGAHRIRAATPGADGRFTLARLPPGAYQLAVVDGVEPDEWLDPLFLRQLVSGSILLTLGEGERKVQDLRVGRR